MLAVILVSCNSLNFCKDKDIRAHYKVMDMIVKYPDTLYSIASDPNYVSERDNYSHFSNKESLIQYIKDNFTYGYIIDFDEVYKAKLRVQDDFIPMHTIVVKSKSARKILFFEFIKYSDKWTLEWINKYYGLPPHPPQD